MMTTFVRMLLAKQGTTQSLEMESSSARRPKEHFAAEGNENSTSFSPIWNHQAENTGRPT